MGGAYGLDFPAVIQMAGLGGAVNLQRGLLLAETLPEVERAIVTALRKDDE